MLTTTSEQTDSLLESSSGIQDLETLWEEVLKHLRPLTAQALLRQHGWLMSCHGDYVEIALGSSALVQLAQRHTQQISLAFKQVLGYTAHVSIQLIKESKSTHTLKQAEADGEKDRDEVMAAAQSLAAFFEGAVAQSQHPTHLLVGQNIPFAI